LFDIQHKKDSVWNKSAGSLVSLGKELCGVPPQVVSWGRLTPWA